MSKRNKIIVVATIIILLLLLLWLFLTDKNEPEVVVVDPVVIEVDNGVIPDSDGSVDMAELIEPDLYQNELSVETVAKSFSERYGSYSNQSEFQNLYDLMPMMTDAFRAETQSLIDRLVVDDEYYGISTHVLSVEVSLLEDESRATCQVQTQREEAWISPQNTEVSYSVLTLDMIKESGDWKVDGATWD